LSALKIPTLANPRFLIPDYFFILKNLTMPISRFHRRRQRQTARHARPRAQPRRRLPLREPVRQRRGRAQGFAAVKPDVVLMDINLPGMNGVECVRQLKKIFCRRRR
jgi:hypothetical protein